MKKRPLSYVLLGLVVVAFLVGWAGRLLAASGWRIVGWNNLGMHCMDPDYSVFSILPPYNTIHAQLVDASGNLVTDPAALGVTVTYEGFADPTGSINTTSADKTNFWQWVGPLYGSTPPVDTGLVGQAMPGRTNQPQPMKWAAAQRWFIAEGIPITPYDDRGAKNPYPMMKLVARDSAGTVLATTGIVLPVSDEMDCSSCHASGGVAAARPAAGWVNDPNPQRDYRLNVLRLHDDRQGGSAAYTSALATVGYSASGLYPTATGGKPVLCAACHGSNALPGTGIAGVSMLTAAVHVRHATVVDPTNGLTLDTSSNRSACYRCHPGSTTKCLRGAMGSAVASDGSLEMQCQSCHGGMSAVGAPTRQGWLEEPACQNCHTGTAVRNAGQIRFTSALTSSGTLRSAVDPIFATNSGAPAPGLDLYRFSYGHGGLACEACHGSTHAEYPSSHANDNIQSLALQGHVGTIAECATCHGSAPQTVNGGPHGLHPLGQAWVEAHHDVAEHSGTTACQACHGSDLRGTVLSQSQADWTASGEEGFTRTFWRGFRIGCYACHNGPGGDGSPYPSATVADASGTGASGSPVAIAIRASDPNGNALTLRVVSQPQHGRAGLQGTQATYYPDDGFAGTDGFTVAAWNGYVDSNLGRVTVNVGSQPAVKPPTVAAVTSLSDPFRVQVTGANFHSALAVTIGGKPWTNVLRSSSTQIVLRGKGLVNLFPLNTWVRVTIKNTDDGGTVAFDYNRTTNAWRPAA